MYTSVVLVDVVNVTYMGGNGMWMSEEKYAITKFSKSP